MAYGIIYSDNETHERGEMQQILLKSMKLKKL